MRRHAGGLEGVRERRWNRGGGGRTAQAGGLSE